jgi:hypothetical protein
MTRQAITRYQREFIGGHKIWCDDFLAKAFTAQERSINDRAA